MGRKLTPKLLAGVATVIALEAIAPHAMAQAVRDDQAVSPVSAHGTKSGL